MKFPDMGGVNGVPASLPRRADPRVELDRVRATCRSQARTIDALGEAVSALRRGSAALEAENAELRAERERLSGGRRRGRAGASGRFDADRAPALIVRLPCDVGAPGAARIAVGDALHDRVAVDVRECAQLLVVRAREQQRAPRRSVLRGCRDRPRRTVAHDGSTRSAGCRPWRCDRPAPAGPSRRRRLRPAACADAQPALGLRTRRRRPHDRLGPAVAHAPGRVGRRRRPGRRRPCAAVADRVIDQSAGTDMAPPAGGRP